DPPRSNRAVRCCTGRLTEEHSPHPYRGRVLLHVGRAYGCQPAHPPVCIRGTVDISGPRCSANRRARLGGSPRAPAPPRRGAAGPVRHAGRVAVHNNIGLVACCDAKVLIPCQARNLYISPLFRAAREFAERSYPAWLILSAKHGVLEPTATVEPYDPCTW